jgi:hypothetical protein
MLNRIEMSINNTDINNEIYRNQIISELKKYRWSLNENIYEKNVVTPKILGYVFEKYII